MAEAPMDGVATEGGRVGRGSSVVLLVVGSGSGGQARRLPGFDTITSIEPVEPVAAKVAVDKAGYQLPRRTAMAYVFGVPVLLFLVALVYGGITGRVRMSSCCAAADPSKDLRMRGASTDADNVKRPSR